MGLADLATGVRALNGLRPWLPVLVALGANSPVWQGADTGFASWRTIQYRRWLVNGIPPRFHDLADYESRVATLPEACAERASHLPCADQPHDQRAREDSNLRPAD